MAHYFCRNSILIWPLLISCFFLQLSHSSPEFSEIQLPHKQSISFLAVGNWGAQGQRNQPKVANQMGIIGQQLGIDFVISTGNNFNPKGLRSVSDPAFNKSFTNIYTAQSLKKPWYAGNHDYMGDTGAQLSPALRRRDERWHCQRNFIVEAGVVDIFFIDTTPFINGYFDNPKKKMFDFRDISMPREKHVATIKRDLKLALGKSRAPWKIVVGHNPITKSSGCESVSREIVDPQLHRILEEEEVNMYIDGREDCLEHLEDNNDSMHFLSSGSGATIWRSVAEHGTENHGFSFEGPGFMSVKITPENAMIAIYDDFGRTRYHRELKKINH